MSPTVDGATPPVQSGPGAWAAPRRQAAMEAMRRGGGLVLAIIAVGIVFTALRSEFLTSSNILELLRSMSSLAIVALGLTLVIIVGELDLSIGAVYGLAAMVMGLLWTAGTPLPLALAAGLCSGLAVGAVNAALTTLCSIPSFIVTLGMLNFVQGVTLWISNAQAVSPAFESGSKISPGALSIFEGIGKAELPLEIPMQVAWMVAIAIVVGIVLHRTLFGFRLMAIGGNPGAARLARLPVVRYKWAAFMAAGLLAAVAGILDFSFLGSTDATSGLSLTFPVFAAVIIGGASLTGGRGTVWGTLIGALLLSMLTNGLALLGVGAYAQLMFVGVVTVTAVGIDQFSRRGEARA